MYLWVYIASLRAGITVVGDSLLKSESLGLLSNVIDHSVNDIALVSTLFNDLFELQIYVYDLLAKADAKISLARSEHVLHDLKMIGIKLGAALYEKCVTHIELILGKPVVSGGKSDRNASCLKGALDIIVSNSVCVAHAAFLRLSKRRCRSESYNSLHNLSPDFIVDFF